jgi:phage protein U
MFAKLGDITFDLLASPTSADETNKYEFAQIDVAEGKPGLQAIGESLKEIKLEFMFHQFFCDPASEIQKIRAAASEMKPLAFILSDATYRGDFVITEITNQITSTDPAGRPLSIRATLVLKEYHVAPRALITKKQLAKRRRKKTKQYDFSDVQGGITEGTTVTNGRRNLFEISTVQADTTRVNQQKFFEAIK